MVRILKKWIDLPCRVKFDDHCKNSTHVIATTAYGLLVEVGAKQIRIRTWDVGKLLSKIEWEVDPNEEFVIARAAVTQFIPWYIKEPK